MTTILESVVLVDEVLESVEEAEEAESVEVAKTARLVVLLPLSVEVLEDAESDKETTLEVACELSEARVAVATKSEEELTSDEVADATEVNEETSEVEVEAETSLATTCTVEATTSTEDEGSTIQNDSISIRFYIHSIDQRQQKSN